MSISVVVPVYNVAEYIRQFLDSLVCQTFKDIEAILVDDGSTDGTDKILDEFAASHTFMTVVHKENGGCMSAWKKGLEHASGDYITFADPDDILFPTIYEKQYKNAIEHGADVAICNMSALQDGKIVPYPTCYGGLKEGCYSDGELLNIKNRLFGDGELKESFFHFSKLNKLFKRELVFRNLHYSKDGIAFGEDVCVSAAAILDCEKLYYTEDSLYIYRIRGESITRTCFRDRETENSLRLVAAVEEMLDDKGFDKRFARIYGQSYHISRLIKKIAAADMPKKEKKAELRKLSESPLAAEYDLKSSKKYLGKKRYLTLLMLKKRHFELLLVLGKIAAKRSGL